MAASGDRQVSARSILRAQAELRRVGTDQAMQRLEQAEADLAEYLMEGLSEVYQRLLALGGPPKRTQRAYRLVQSLLLVCVEALRQSHYELWRQDAAGTRLTGIDPSLGRADDDDEGDADAPRPPPPPGREPDGQPGRRPPEP